MNVGGSTLCQCHTVLIDSFVGSFEILVDSFFFPMIYIYIYTQYWPLVDFFSLFLDKTKDMS